MKMVQRIRLRIILLMVGFVLLTDLARATPRKMPGWDFPRRQTETTGKTSILLTTTRYYQLANIFFPWKFVTVVLWSSGKGRWHQLFFSSRFFLLYRNRVTFSRLLVKKPRCQEDEGKKKKEEEKEEEDGVCWWSIGSLNELSSHFLLFLLFEFDDYFSSFLSSCLPSSASR